MYYHQTGSLDLELGIFKLRKRNKDSWKISPETTIA